MITSRIREKFSDHISNNTLVYRKELTDLELETINKRSSSSLHKKSKKSLSSNRSNENLTHHGFSLKSKELNNTLSHQLGPASTTEYPKINNKDNSEETKEKSVKKEKTHIITPRISSHLQHKRRETGNSQDEAENSESKKTLRLKTTNKEAADQKAISNKLADEVHKKKHEKWLKFL